MKVKIYDLNNKVEIEAKILELKDYKGSLPSLTDHWRFNFNKHSKMKNTKTYVLVCENDEEVPEGCLIFEMRDKIEPFMAYVEIVPHNKGKGGRFDKVAGCLIAFACRLSFKLGEADYKGWLSFEIGEPTKEEAEKLMGLYSEKYKAVRFQATNIMIIAPKEGEELIEFYLNS